MARTEAQMLKCPRCGHALAMWLDASEDWQPLGARIKRRRTDRGRASLVCPLCGAMKRLPDDGEPDEQSA